MEQVQSAVEKFSTNFSKTKTILFLSLLYNGDNIYLLDKRKETYKIRSDN